MNQRFEETYSINSNIFAIDVNIVRHLFVGIETGKPINSKISNTDSHITRLFSNLIYLEDIFTEGVKLLVDSNDEILKEYERMIIDQEYRLSSKFSANEVEVRHLQWFTAKLRLNSFVIIDVNYSDSLLKDIMRLGVPLELYENPNEVDALLVYVAFKEGKWLLTNDYKDMIDGYKPHSGQRRKQLMALKARHPEARILTSRGVASDLCIVP